MAAIPDSISFSILGGSFGSGEVFLIFVVILLLFGSKSLPHIARRLGRTLEELRRAARDVSNEIVRTDLSPSNSKNPKDSDHELDP